MGEPAELSDRDREEADRTAFEIWKAVRNDEAAPLDMLQRCARLFSLRQEIEPETLLLHMCIVSLERKAAMREYSAQAVTPAMGVHAVAREKSATIALPDLVTEAQTRLQEHADHEARRMYEDEAAKQRAREARELYGKPSKSIRARVDNGNYVRVSGDVVCESCGFEYHDHSPIPGFPWLRFACDGRLLKL